MLKDKKLINDLEMLYTLSEEELDQISGAKSHRPPKGYRDLPPYLRNLFDRWPRLYELFERFL